MIRRTTPLPAAILVLLVVTGCATAPEHTPPDGAAPGAAQESRPPPRLPDDTAAAARLELPELKLVPTPEPPVRGLSRENLFRLLVADLAGRGGDVETALENYLETAREQRDPRIAERATRLALHVGNDEAALAASRRWVELAPDSREAHAVLARMWLRRGDAARARVELRRVIELTEGGAAAGLREVAALVSETERPATALAAIGELAAEHPGVATAHFAVADLAARVGAPEQALAAIERALDLEPFHTEALVLRARIQIDQGRADHAFIELARAHRRRPGDRGLALGFVRLLIETDRTGEARERMQQVHERFGEDPFAVRTLALLAMQGEIWDQATLYLERLVAMNAHVSMARYYLGRIAHQEGECEQALRHYVKVGRGDHRFDAQLRAAVCMAEVGRLDEARLHLERMQSRYDAAEAAARIAITRAEVERGAGHADRALEVLGDALERQPEHRELRYARALTAAEADRFDVARRDLNRILEHDPDDPRALNALGYLLADRGLDLARARSLIERALAQQPDDAATLDSMGWVLYRQGEHRRAVEYLRRAYAIDPGPEIAAHLGEVLWELGRRDEARRIWEQARGRQGSGHETLERTTRRLQQP